MRQASLVADHLVHRRTARHPADMNASETTRIENLSRNLAANLRTQRTQRGLTQAGLAKLAELPRSTIANLEVGGANPTLSVMARLADALGLSLEELLSAPAARVRGYRSQGLRERRRGRQAEARAIELLPEATPGTAFERMSFAPGARLPGVPHHPGTREHLYVERGKLRLHGAGETIELGAGDVATFAGDQAHSYANAANRESVGYSVVLLPPLAS